MEPRRTCQEEDKFIQHERRKNRWDRLLWIALYLIEMKTGIVYLVAPKKAGDISNWPRIGIYEDTDQQEHIFTALLPPFPTPALSIESI